MQETSTKEMETLSGAIRRLEDAGFSDDFRARPDGLVARQASRVYAPEDLVVDEIVRFEGDSDPSDEAVLFALHASDGSARGTFVATYGTLASDPAAAEIMKRLEAPARQRYRVQ